MPMSTPAEGLQLRTRWLGREFVPYDEIGQLEGDQLCLASGQRHSLSTEQRACVERALAPPVPSGELRADALALVNYAAQDWSPRRAAHALLAAATAAGASDLHLVAEAQGFTSQLRIAGALVDFVALPQAAGTRLVAALKHVAGCLPYRCDVVQEGRIPRQGITADARASFMPTALGERAAVRLFGRLLDLGQLGFEDAVRVQFEALLERRSGLLLVAGPSGAGKTTTIYAALARLAQRRGDAHLSLEDPVEQRLRLAGIPVDQVELCPARGLTAEAALVGALRQDVDVIAVGEIRDAPQASLALEAAHTGRLVLAGLHAGSPHEAVQRLLDLGAERGVLESSLLGVLHQRLETRPCSDCSGQGCSACAGLGRVRVPVASLLEARELF